MSPGCPGARMTLRSPASCYRNQRTAPLVPVALVAEVRHGTGRTALAEPPGGGSSCPTLPAGPGNRLRHGTVRHSARYSCRSRRPVARPPRLPAVTCPAATPRQREPSHARPPRPPTGPRCLVGPRRRAAGPPGYRRGRSPGGHPHPHVGTGLRAQTAGATTPAAAMGRCSSCPPTSPPTASSTRSPGC